MAGPIRIVGVGSSHGDDAVAWHVIEELRTRLPGSSAIETHRIGGGERLLDLIDGCGVLILIDAVQTAEPPGTIVRFAWPDPRIESLSPGSTHECSPAAALRLAETLGWIVKRVIVFGVAIAEAGPLPGLTPAVQVAVPVLADAVVRELESLVVAGRSEAASA
jgi:hydrogenase maturation protease